MVIQVIDLIVRQFVQSIERCKETNEQLVGGSYWHMHACQRAQFLERL